MACATANAWDVWCSCHLTAPRRRTITIIFTEYWLVIIMPGPHWSRRSGWEFPNIPMTGTCCLVYTVIYWGVESAQRTRMYCSPTVNKFKDYSFTVDPFQFCRRILYTLQPFSNWWCIRLAHAELELIVTELTLSRLCSVLLLRMAFFLPGPCHGTRSVDLERTSTEVARLFENVVRNRSAWTKNMQHKFR